MNPFRPFDTVFRPFTVPMGGGAVDPLAALIASLFGNDEQGGLWLPSPKYCWKDTAGTIPCTAAGDLVARMDDISGNGNHTTQASIDARPQLQQTAGGLWYLAFDGTDDRMLAVYAATLANITRGIAVRFSDDFIFDDNDTQNDCSLYSIADGDLRFAVSGGTSGRNIVASGGWGRGVDHVVTVTAASTRQLTVSGTGNSASGTSTVIPNPVSGITIGAAHGTNTFALAGRVYGAVDVSRVVTAEERAEIEQFLAARSGVTLP